MGKLNRERIFLTVGLISDLYRNGIEPGLISISHICGELGVTRAMFYHWRNGTSAPRIRLFERLIIIADRVGTDHANRVSYKKTQPQK